MRVNRLLSAFFFMVSFYTFHRSNRTSLISTQQYHNCFVCHSKRTLLSVDYISCSASILPIHPPVEREKLAHTTSTMSITSPRALIKGSLEKLLSEAKSSQLKDVIKAALEKLKTEEHAQPTPPTQQESGEAGETRPSVVEEHTEEDILKFK